jgi:hypothetical protein
LRKKKAACLKKIDSACITMIELMLSYTFSRPTHDFLSQLFDKHRE